MNKKTNNSLRRLPHLWLVRLGVVFFVLLIGSLNLNRNLVLNEVSNSFDWANMFADVNQLLLEGPKEEISNKPQLVAIPASLVEDSKPYFASSNNEVKLLQRKELAGLMLTRTEKVFITPTAEKEDIEPYVDYNAQLAAMYALRSNQSKKENSLKHVRYETGGGIGPTIIDNELNVSTAQLYENLAGKNNVNSTVMGGSSSKITDAYNAVFNVGIGVGGRLTINTGVSYAQFTGSQQVVLRNHVQEEHTFLVFKSTGPGRDGIAVPTTETIHSFSNDTLNSSVLRRTIEIPLALKYTIGKRRLNYFVQSGINTVISANITGNYSSNEIEDTRVNSQLNGISSLNLIVSGGLQYEMFDQFHLNISPNYQVPFYQSVGALPAYNRLGILTGVNYTF